MLCTFMQPSLRLDLNDINLDLIPCETFIAIDFRKCNYEILPRLVLVKDLSVIDYYSFYILSPLSIDDYETNYSDLFGKANCVKANGLNLVSLCFKAFSFVGHAQLIDFIGGDKINFQLVPSVYRSELSHVYLEKFHSIQLATICEFLSKSIVDVVVLF